MSAASSSPAFEFEPFILLTSRLIIVPTPISISFQAFRTMYAHIHSLPEFCNMAFGPHWPPVSWTDEQCVGSMQRGINLCWNIKGMGDFTVGLLPSGQDSMTPPTSAQRNSIKIVKGENYSALAANPDFWSNISWVGYAGVRDAVSSTSMPSELTASPSLPSWEEMVEIRYGFHPEHWGKGYATEAATAVMAWAAGERGTRRFIAETEKANSGSGKVLGKLGFQARSANEYWGEESQVEWERIV